ncbi:MAG TPA: DsbA family oxidoreductase [Solirubrobacteraceae bacterium]|jgi:predicted DsbA family dithiol-disulfide isomerase|nr:DsbA family oxidoreductase [Solirubrobacteraceae bacterium]
MADLDPFESSMTMTVEIFVDLICPHSYIAVRRFEAALAQFEAGDHVEVVWRGFQLDTRRERSYAEILVRRMMRNHGMSRAEALDVTVHVQATLADAAAREGLAYQPATARPVNTFDAHRMLHLAAEHGRCHAAVRRIQQAYFADGMAIGDPETLAMLVAGVGVDLDEARLVALGDAYSDAVLEDRERAESLGIGGVPFFLFDERYAVSGAQSARWLLAAMRHCWSPQRV